MTIPRVTWLLPVKNGMPFLPEALRSIEGQTYKDVTLIAWDNGSSDGTVEELRRWIPSRIPGRVVTDRPDTIGGSLREMVREAETEFCARMDADDISSPERLAAQVAFLDQNPDVAVVGSQVRRIDEAGKDVLAVRVPFPTTHAELVATLVGYNPMCHPTVMFRRGAVLAVGGYREMPMIEDYDLWFRLAAAGFHLANLPEPLLRYRHHDQSVTQVAYKERRLWDLGNTCVLENAPALYTCSRKTVELLRGRRHPLAILPISLHLRDVAREHGGSALRLFVSPGVAVGMSNLVPPRDYLSRAVLKLGRGIGKLIRSRGAGR